MSQIKISTNFNIDLEFNIAPFHRRLFAWMIDVVILIIYYIIVVKILDKIKFKSETADDHWLFLTLMLPMCLYPVITEYTMKGQTVGKKLLSIKVINETGGNATLSQFLLRWLLRVSDFILVLMIIILVFLGGEYLFFVLFFFAVAVTDVLCVALTKKGQRLGDMAASTLLISTTAKSSIQETVFVEVADTYTPVFPQVMKLSDRDLSTIKTIYNTIIKNNDYVMASQIAGKIQAALKIETKMDPNDFIETVLKDYNYLSTR